MTKLHFVGSYDLGLVAIKKEVFSRFLNFQTKLTQRSLIGVRMLLPLCEASDCISIGPFLSVRSNTSDRFPSSS